VTAALNPKFTLETFVVGSANRLAVTAGRTVAESPGSAYNPLFIYSASGLGKTHLLMAMGHAARRLAPGLNVEYLTLDEFVEAFHAAVAAGQGEAVRQRVQSVDMLLVDDVQFLTNRKEMQAELLRLTEALLSAGHQIVLASDRPPNEIANLDERLISRFSGGLVVDMGPPTTRRASRSCGARRRSVAVARGPGRGGGARAEQRSRADGRAEPAGRLPGGE
jgi:chromosomal replication initiator protein